MNSNKPIEFVGLIPTADAIEDNSDETWAEWDRLTGGPTIVEPRLLLVPSLPEAGPQP